MSWLRKFGIAFGGILLVMGLTMLGRPARERKKAENREIDYLASHVKGSAEKARKQALKAENHKAEATEAAKVGIKAISEVKDAELSNLISNWSAP